jgi:hypothetical protein
MFTCPTAGDLSGTVLHEKKAIPNKAARKKTGAIFIFIVPSKTCNQTKDTAIYVIRQG